MARADSVRCHGLSASWSSARPTGGVYGRRMADTPRIGPRGEPLCAWCGGEIPQPATGRRREYCRRSCRQRAYEERRTQERIRERLRAATAPADPSRDAPIDPSRDAPIDPSRDGTMDALGRAAAAYRRLEAGAGRRPWPDADG